jgi:hypothetical protein
LELKAFSEQYGTPKDFVYLKILKELNTLWLSNIYCFNFHLGCIKKCYMTNIWCKFWFL